MRFSQTLGSSCATGTVLLVCDPAAALALGAVGDPSAPWPFFAAILLSLGGFAAGVLISGDGAAWWRGRILRRRIGALDVPGAITGTDGRIGWANGPMRSEFGERLVASAPGIGEVLALDEGVIYRLATRARKMGFSFMSFESEGAIAAGANGRLLTARYDEPGQLVWTLLPPHNLSRDEAGLRAPDLKLVAPLPGDSANASAAPDNAAAAPQWQGAGPENSEPSAPEDLTRARLDKAFDLVPVALIQVDLAGRIRSANNAAREILRDDPGPGSALAEMIEPLGRPMEAMIEDAADSPSGQREMVRLRDNADGDSFLQVFLTPTEVDGEASLLAMLTDVSELRLLEDKFAQSQKMEAVGKLAGGVAHDFNNVLTAISGHSDLLLLGKDALHPDYSDLMQIRQNTHRAAALVRQLLAFSRKQTLNPAFLSVQDVVSDTRYLLDRLIGEKVSLVMEHGRELGHVRADHQQLEQALMNLVVNARDAMPNGGTTTITTRKLRLDERQSIRGVEIRSGDYVEICVADEGPGIEPALLDKVFDPFFTTKPVGEGTGLGLSTVYGIVKQSAGYVFAENRPEGGAMFRILLPRVRAAETGGAATPVPVQSVNRFGGPRSVDGDLTGSGTILLVEDEDPVRAFAARALTMRGYEVFAAADAEEAMEFLTENERRVDLLVSDVMMPGMDGPTFAGEARKLRPDLKVIFVSGYAEDSFRKNLQDHDFIFLPKPFSLTELTAKVKEALDGED